MYLPWLELSTVSRNFRGGFKSFKQVRTETLIEKSFFAKQCREKMVLASHINATAFNPKDLKTFKFEEKEENKEKSKCFMISTEI